MKKERKWTDEQLIRYARESQNYTQLAKKLGLVLPNTYLRNKVKQLQIDVSHFVKLISVINVIEVEKVIKQCYSYTQVLRALNLSIYGSNHRSLKRLVKRNKINVSHFTGVSTDLISKNKRALEDLLVIGSNIESSSLKKRLLKAGLVKNQCSICGINKWLKKALTCHLDHINGIKDDNRMENLRMLCPNCHSQTETYCGRNKKTEKI